MHPEGGGLGGHPDPEPGLLAGLAPAGLVDVDRTGPADGLEELGDLMAEGLGILAVEGVATAGAGRGPDLDGAGQLLGGDQLTRTTLVAGLTTARLPGGGLGRLSLEMERLGGGWPGGVRGVLVQPCFEGGDPLLERLDRAEDRRLHVEGCPGPEVIGQWRLDAHAIWRNRPEPRAQAPTGHERLPSKKAASPALAPGPSSFGKPLP